MKSAFTNQFTPSSANAWHYTVLLSFPLLGQADLDAVKEDDDDKRKTIQRTLTFVLTLIDLCSIFWLTSEVADFDSTSNSERSQALKSQHLLPAGCTDNLAVHLV